MKFHLSIDLPSPSGNYFAYSHWSVRRKDKQKWSVLILFAIKNSENQDRMAANGKRRITVERYCKRPLDPDNLVSGLKGIIDSFREFGLIVDDDDKHLELLCYNRKIISKNKQMTVFTFEDI